MGPFAHADLMAHPIGLEQPISCRSSSPAQPLPLDSLSCQLAVCARSGFAQLLQVPCIVQMGGNERQTQIPVCAHDSSVSLCCSLTLDPMSFPDYKATRPTATSGPH